MDEDNSLTFCFAAKRVGQIIREIEEEDSN
jgi:hypothetical protein